MTIPALVNLKRLAASGARNEDIESIDLHEGQALAAFGGNGSGIEDIITLLIDHALDRPVEVEKYSVNFHFDRMRPGCLGVLFDDASWSFCNLKVDEEIAFVLENSGLPPSEMPKLVDDALDQVGLTGFGSRQLSTLSGGELRKVALAAIIVGRPKLIVSDDLNGHLDLAALDQLETVLNEYVEKNRACWIDFRRRWNDFSFPGETFATLEDGNFSLHKPEKLGAFGMALGVPFGQELADHLSTQLGAKSPQLNSPQDAVQWLSDLRAELVSESTVRAIGDPLLKASEIGFGFERGKPLLHGLDLTLMKGCVYALGGKNGAGKSTLARLLCGLRKPQSGEISLHGSQTSTKVLRRTGSLVFQKPEYQFIADSVKVELAVAIADGKHGTSSESMMAIAETFDLVRLMERHPFSLDIGEKRRLSVACAIAGARDVLIVDEPTLGQDEMQTRLLGAQLQIAAGTNTTVLVITHDPEFIAGYCDEVLWLEDGKVTELGKPEEAFMSTSGSMFAGKSHLLNFWELACEASLATGNAPRNLKDLRVAK
jgi:energy-coupling factor transport system ATP-binding protein